MIGELLILITKRYLSMRWILLLLVLPSAVRGQDQVTVDLETGWLRRDWSKCQSESQWVVQNDQVRFSATDSDVLYWQVPTRAGVSLPVGRGQDWVARCDRPPLTFWNKMRAEDKDHASLLQVEEYRYAQWNWSVRGELPVATGRQPVAELGFSILRKGKNEVRQLIYRWHDQAVVDTFRVSEQSVAFGFYKLKRAHIVVHVAVPGATWAVEFRDLYADYVRAFPKEEPGRVGRVYVKLPKDGLGDGRAVEFTNLRFSRSGTDVGRAGEGRGEVRP